MALYLGIIRKTLLIIVIINLLFLICDVYAQNIYELRKYTDQDWLKMETDERLHALGISTVHARSQTFFGRFGRNYDLYTHWGYDYYEMEDRYQNYASRGFENYNIIEDRRQKWTYNDFGDRLTKMTNWVNLWRETHYSDGTTSVNGPWRYGYINSRLGVDVDGIWVARESTDDWAVSVVAAGALRIKFTPLTMSIPNLNGVKVDFQSEKYAASMVNSRYLPETKLGQNVLLLRGGQLKRKFGALTIGATYANMYAVQTNRDKGSDLKGNVTDYAPTPLIYALRIVDDSPNDGNGPIVQEVKLKVNGIYRPDIQPQIIIDDLRRELITAVTSKSEMHYLDYGTNYTGQDLSFDELTLNERTPKYLDYLYMNDYIRGWNSEYLNYNFSSEKGKKYYNIIDPGGKPIQVNGNEYVVYLFDLGSIKDNVNRVEVEVTVANDYRIQTSQIYTKEVKGGHDSSGENLMHYTASYWSTMAQAEGNIKDGSNLRTLTVNFGYEVGNLIYGFDAHFNYRGLKINGEFVTNIHNYMFSDGVPGTGLPSSMPTDITPRDGHRFTQADNSYYITVEKNWQRFGFAGEYFTMGKFYRPYMNHFVPSEKGGRDINVRNDTLRMDMIADNDDDDQYPDTQYINKSMGVGLSSLMDPDGVFPGNDLDNDGYPDNEKNDNNYPDYDEPFLMFDVDPNEFIFGDDFNNNTIPDHREDDMKYDTPYDLDRKGHHFYFRFTPQKNIDFMLGSLRTRGVGLDNRTYDDYFKAKFDCDLIMVGKLFTEYRYERIQDNIQDKFVVVPTKTRYTASSLFQYSRYNRDLYYDEVEYRNSKVQKLFVEARVRAIPAITIENHIKLERNQQLEGTMYDKTFQPEDIVTTFAMVNKFIYTKQLGNWTFSPGIKFRLFKKHRSESFNPLDHFMLRIPLVYLKYRISPKTNITLGFQGFKGFELLYKDYIQDHNNYRKVDQMLQIENKTEYFGFDTFGAFGFKIEQMIFEEEYRKFEEYKSSSFFVKIWVGY